MSGSNFENTTTVSIAINGENVQEISISGGSFTLVIITSENAEPGVYRVTVTASGAALVQDAQQQRSTPLTTQRRSARSSHQTPQRWTCQQP